MSVDAHYTFPTCTSDAWLKTTGRHAKREAQASRRVKECESHAALRRSDEDAAVLAVVNLHLGRVVAYIDIAVLTVLNDEHLPIDHARLFDAHLYLMTRSAHSYNRACKQNSLAACHGDCTCPLRFENMKSLGSGFFFSQLNSSFFISASLPSAGLAAAGFAALVAACCAVFVASGAAFSTRAFLASGTCA